MTIDGRAIRIARARRILTEEFGDVADGMANLLADFRELCAEDGIDFDSVASHAALLRLSDRQEQLCNLVNAAERALSVRDDEGVTWEERYDRIFPARREEFQAAADALGWRTEWADPDSSYEHDVKAWCGMVEDLRDRARSELSR